MGRTCAQHANRDAAAGISAVPGAKRSSGYMGLLLGALAAGLGLTGRAGRQSATLRRLAQWLRLPLPVARQPEGDGMGTIYEALMLILNVVWFVMIAHIIMSWLINFRC